MTNVSIMSSAEQYFRAGVLKEKSDISAGLGLPDPTLAGCLAVCWLLLYLTLKGAFESKVLMSIIFWSFIFVYVCTQIDFLKLHDVL